MTCKNCVIAITDAVMKADPAAAVSIDLGRQHVVIESDLTRHRLKEVILDEGFVVA
jgi:copper chaperone CopZ